MTRRSIMITVGLFIVTTITISVGYAALKPDPFAAYRDFEKGPLAITPKELKHFQDEERLIREKLKLDLSKRERAILAGLHWIISYVDNDKNFEFLFPDFMLLMNSLKNSGNRIHQKEIVTSIIKKALTRELPHLKELPRDENSRFEFIRVLDIAKPYPEVFKSYVDFYKEHFASQAREPYLVQERDFKKAMKEDDYQVIFSYLVHTSFLHYLLASARELSHQFPADKFPQYMKEFEGYKYNLNYPGKSKEFRELGYLVTHIPLVLTNYGEFPIKNSINADKARKYIDKTLHKARYELGDFDLFAEYIQCIKILNPKGDPRIPELEQFLYDLQRPDGSWGSARDFKTNPYTAIHPGGAALMALNQSIDE